MSKQSTPQTVSAALRILANDITSPDDVPAQCLREAAGLIESQAAEIVRIEDLAEDVCRLMNENDWSGAFRETREALRLFNRFVCNECGAQQKSTTEPFRCERCGGELETKVVHKPFWGVSND